MNITLEFYGRLLTTFSQQATVYQTEHTTVAALFEQLCQENQVKHDQSNIRPIINDEFADWQSVINNNDVIGFLPPASGG